MSWRRGILAACALAGSLLAAAAFDAQEAPLSPQSLANLRFAGVPEYERALAELPPIWPPLYPSLLWLGDHTLVPHPWVNPALFLLTLALLWLACRRLAPGVEPAVPVAAWALCSFHYPNLHQYVAEALLVPLALGLFLCLQGCLRSLQRRDLLAAGVLGAAALLTRYFALFWLLPAIVLAIATSLEPGRPRRLRLALTVGALCTLPVALWMLEAWRETGHLTGTPRFTPRGYETATSLWGNLVHTARTVQIDFLSPGLDARSATHLAVGREWGPAFADRLSAATGGLLAAACLGVSGCLARGRRRADPTRRDPAGRIRLREAVLLAWFSGGYLLVLWLLWTLGNNDPLYSRFLYPSYVFFLLGGLRLYEGVGRAARAGAAPTWLPRLPFQLLLSLVVGIQASRMLGLVLAR